jgi:hypothetical protein
MASFDGTWIYQSFCPQRGTSDIPAQIAVPWSPPGRLTVTTDAGGRVDGELRFKLPPPSGGELVFTISGSITPAVAGKLPEGVELTGENGDSVNRIRGYFIPGSAGPLIVGTIVAIKNDPGRQPDGASGPFVLFPAGG